MNTRFVRHLPYFLAVAEELHFGRAAVRLGISQPPLSQRIRRLEEELGVNLFIRTKHLVELTHAGSLLLEHVRRIMQEAEVAARIVRQADSGEVGRLELAFTPSADLSFVPQVLPLLKRRFPGINLELHVMHGPRQVEALRQNRIHAGILRLPTAMNNNDISVETVFCEPLVVILPQTHSLARHERLSLGQLANEPFIFFSRDVAPGYYDLVMTLCRQQHFTPRVVQETDSIHTTVSLVSADVGISLQPASVRHVQRPGVVCSDLETPQPMVEIGVAYRKDDKSMILKNFLSVAHEFAGNMMR